MEWNICEYVILKIIKEYKKKSIFEYNFET